MARPLRNRSSFWTPECYRILEAAAVTVLHKIPGGIKEGRGMYEVEDLIVWAWFTVVRYGGPLFRMPLRCHREMYKYVNWCNRHLRENGPRDALELSAELFEDRNAALLCEENI